MSAVISFVRISRPWHLLGAALLYALGVGVARYLGIPIDWTIYLIGQIWITLIQLSTYYLDEYFAPTVSVLQTGFSKFSGENGSESKGTLTRTVPFVAALTTLTITASLTVFVFRLPAFNSTILIVSGIIFLGAFFYSTPPLRLANSGYGEIIMAVLISNLVPAFAFLLQTGELHRLLAMTTFPLTLLHLPMFLAFGLPNYGTDLKYERNTLMVRTGWETGMRIHNLSLLVAYLILGLAIGFGLPISIGLPGFLTFPLAIFQVWYMNRIASGIKPNWTLLLFIAATIYGLTAYLITFALWTR
jgi:1,4-dihydroxy-2-naphthoate polyprenyltransferase